MLTDTLKELCALDGVSGREQEVRERIVSLIGDKAEVSVDPLGNIIAFCKGRRKAEKRLMISAHMDEVGFIVTYINDDGTLCFAPVGGIDPRVCFGKRVRIGRDKVYGVIGGTAVHNIPKKERNKVDDLDKLVIDIGADSKEQASKLIRQGDSVYFEGDLIRFGSGMIRSKAIDDRAGCAVMLEMINEGVEFDTYFTFVVQEEIGLRGSGCAAFTVEPDFAIILEATTASDIPSESGADKVCEVGKGAVVSIMDRHTIYDKDLCELAFRLAEENGIPCQTKTKIAGGNDAGAVHVSRGGVRTAAISVPCRYLHSPSCVINEDDLMSVYRLAKLLADGIQTNDL
ncbi:MAG: M42 family peptidase [Ruminococcus sp.]|nr:M42 family peptidase [Ruminococcus sp.]